MSVNYDFLGIDEGKQNLLRGNTGSGIIWIESLKGYPSARAMQRLDEDRVLIGYDRGYFIFSLTKREVIYDCSRWEQVSFVYRNSDGTTLICGLNLGGNDGVCLLTLDTHDNVIQQQSRPGDYVRLMTVAQDRYLFSTNDHISIVDRELNTVGTLSADGFLHAWQSCVLSDGNILVTAGYGAFIGRFSANGELLSTFGGVDHVPEEVKPYFYATMRIVENGNILVVNWQGHGADNGEKGRQLLLFSKDGEYLESWSFPRMVSSLQGLLLL